MNHFAGEFETHLTVAHSSTADDEDRLRGWAERHGVKYTRIMLDRGATPDQPMLTVRGHGFLYAQREAALTWAERLCVEGFEVARVKIEASPWNEGVPQSAAEAQRLSPEHYFEHHIKLALLDGAEVAAVRALAGQHTAHVSRNARRDLGGRGHERFVTQRCRGVGRTEARRRLDALLDVLAAAGFKAVEVEEEFVVYDDRPALDSGWIDETAEVR
ncbi:hypothetical protein [Streptomyces sp. NPDC004324]